MYYKPNVDLVNDNVYTKFGLIQFIHSQDIEQKPKYVGMTERETDRITERQTGQIQHNPTFSKRGYKNIDFTVLHQSVSLLQ